MGKGGSAQQEVNDYRMSLHYGICTGPVILREIKIDDKVVWQGRMTEAGPIPINDPTLFGGPKKEGGVSGIAYFLPGKPDQVMPTELARRFGLTSATCPAFRGVATIFFIGSNSGAISGDIWGTIVSAFLEGWRRPGGFLWSSNTPFIRPVKVKVERAPVGLNPTLAMIGDNANPGHMIYECLTDIDWGMAAPDYLIDKASFETAAQKLYNEQFVMSIFWTQQDTVEKYVGEILDHVLATVFVNPKTGLLSILLLRDDYDLNLLPVINPSNARMKNFKRKMYGETINEVNVSWTNPENEKSETITAQDLANIEIQGSPVSDNRNYYGIRSAELAARIAARDSASASAPLALLEVELDRSGWDLLPGSVVRVDWPRYRLNNTICRVMKISYGKAGDSKISVSLMEDIFSLSKPVTIEPPNTGWKGVDVDPTPMQFSQIFTLPYFLAAKEDSSDHEYPTVLAGVLAYQPGGATTSFDLLTERLQANGALGWQSVGTKTIVGRSSMLTPLYAEPTSQVIGLPLTGEARGPVVNGLVIIGDGTEAGSEIALLYELDDATWTVKRGVLDTVPRSWPVGTPVWFIPPNSAIADTLEMRSVGENPGYKLLTRTSRGVLPFESAPTVSGAMSARPHAPLRPANVRINGTSFGDVDATGASKLSLAWATRNRLTEDSIVIPWDAGSITPEYLQMTIVTVFRENGSPMITWRGLYSETSLEIPIAYIQQEKNVYVRVSSERAGISSIQGHGLWVRNIPQIANPAPPPVIPEPPPPPPPATPPPPTPDPVQGPQPTEWPGVGIPGEWV